MARQPSILPSTPPGFSSILITAFGMHFLRYFVDYHLRKIQKTTKKSVQIGKFFF